MSTRHLRLGFEATRANKNLNVSFIPALQIKATYLSSILAATEVLPFRILEGLEYQN